MILGRPGRRYLQSDEPTDPETGNQTGGGGGGISDPTLYGTTGSGGRGIAPSNLADFEWFYANVIQAHPEWFDPSIPKAQWAAWEPNRDKSVMGPNPYRYESKDSSGNPISGLANKPVDCPDGTTKYGSGQCLELDNPKVQGVKPGAGAAAPDYGVSDLVNNLVFQRMSAEKGWGFPGAPKVPAGYTGGNSGFGSIPGLIDDRYGGQANALALQGGGLAWGGIDPSWAGLSKLIQPRGPAQTDAVLPWSETAPITMNPGKPRPRAVMGSAAARTRYQMPF